MDPLFDVSQLDEIELGHLEFVLNSPSWALVFDPYLRKVLKSLETRLKDPAKQRKDEYPDDFLRGEIAAIEGLLAFITKIVDETQMERIHAARAKSAEEAHARRVATGQIGPAGQALEPDYDPDEF